MFDADEPDVVDPRRELWRRGSYEIVGDWLAPASVAVLDRIVEHGVSLDGRRVLDLATGTGTVAIEAARRGADVTGVDLTDELIAVARQRADQADVRVAFAIGDFDRLDELFGDSPVADPSVGMGFDAITSAFGVIFAPEPKATLVGMGHLLAPHGVIAVSSWEPDGVFVVPDTMLELFPERPTMPDMGAWTTGAEALCTGTPFEVASLSEDELVIPFASVAAAADQLERWSGGWSQLLETFDGLGVGREARTRLVDHLAHYCTTCDEGVGLRARFHVSVLRRSAPAG